jgi:prepilin-type N-terminal cleavage/methylation domain-containing protein
MSRLSAADRRRAGFTLLEVLVALIVAALFLEALTRALGASWWAARRPMEQVSALAIARAAAAEAGSRAPGPEGRIKGFAYVTTIEPLTPEQRSAELAPLPPRDDGTAVTVRTGPPLGRVNRIRVVVTAPSGRRLIFETLKVDTSRS